MGMARLERSSADGMPERQVCVPVTVDVIGLVRALVGPATEEERFEWARHILLQAQQTDGDLQHLYASISRRGARRQRHAAQVAAHPPRTRETPTVNRSDSSVREEVAADVAELAQQVMAVAVGKPQPRELDKRAFDPSEAQTRVDGGDLFLDDTLRAGRASTVVVPRVEPEQATALAAADSIRLCRPQWSAGADARLTQATLRFEPPGVEAGEKVLVEGPNGEQITLIVPPGVMHVQRAIAVVNRGQQRRADSSLLQLDIVPLSPDAVPGGRVDVSGVPLLLPPYAVPGTSICVALPALPA